MTFKEMQQLKAQSGRVIANVQNGLGVNLKNRPVVVLISDLDGFTYFLKTRSANNELTPWEKLIDTKDYEVIIPFANGEQNQHLDCGKIYKMKKDDFDELYKDPVLLYNYNLDIVIDIYEYVYQLTNWNRIHTPEIALIEVNDNKTKKMDFITLYINEKIFNFEKNNPATPIMIFDNIIGQEVDGIIFKKRVLNLYNRNLDTLETIYAIHVEIGEILIKLHDINKLTQKQWKKENQVNRYFGREGKKR